MSDATGHKWWGQLRHDGVLVSPQLLDEFFPTLAELPERDYDRLRDAWLTFEAATDPSAAKRDYTEAVLQRFCGLVGWQKGNQVADRFKATSPTGQKLRPDWILTGDSGEQGLLAVTFDDARRLGIGRGKRAFARTADLLRATGVPFAILTNGQQFRLVHAGPDFAAWTEWDAAAWFDEAEGREQLRGLRALLGHGSLVSPAEGTGLLAAVRASRHRQGDLAQVLGEQVRQAIEHVIDALDGGLRSDPDLLRQVHKDPGTGQDIGEEAVLRAIYQAATRVAMRLVVLLYAEARELLPRSNEVYHQSYGVDALYQQLSAAAQHAGDLGALADRSHAWSRLLALFRIVHEGSPHQDLPIRDYGGTLFRRGDVEDVDPVLRALAVLEQHGPNDATVLRILRLLKIGKVKVRKGRKTTWVSGPVDFSDLRTEYIGIIYEGLLDFELKRAPDEDAIIFLNLGRQPALPLARLEGMGDKQLKQLISELRKDKAATDAASEDDEPAEAADESDDDEARTEAEEELEPELDAAGDEALRQRGAAWAERAAEVARLVRRTKNMSSSEYARRRAEAGRKLIERVVGPQQLYLATWGGLRKGTGTFYTRPALAVSTTQRALEPLCYDVVSDGLRPKAPEDILELKVCDPAMGSGSFPVAALRYLTTALTDSLLAHDRIHVRGDGSVATLPFGREATGEAQEELLPVPPDDERFDDLLRSRLARHVVERCIYGVDINPMAVELARLALWVETMNRELPFEFLDHKLKFGNSLVGGRLHQVEDYPALGWDREAGDGSDGEQSAWLKGTLQNRVKTELVEHLRASGGQLRLLDEFESGPRSLITEVRSTLERIHELPREQREEAYRELMRSDAYQQVKADMDAWCAVWFWPTDEESREPALTPSAWRRPTPEARATIERVAESNRFFHWELEFADVFATDRPGFDCVIGNPPWELIQPESLEFFSNHDPLYRTYERQVAEARREELFEGVPMLQQQWVDYQSSFKSLSNFVKQVIDPGRTSLGRRKEHRQLADWWAEQRAERCPLAGADHPYRYQGTGKNSTYKLFLELGHYLLTEGGRLGFIVPSGTWTDQGTTGLRNLFLDSCRWEWVHGFENRDQIFPIESRFEFAPIILQRGGKTSSIRTSFMRHNLADWEAPTPEHISVPMASIRRFSPTHRSFMQFRSRRDLDLAEALYADHSYLGSEVENSGGGHSQEINLTSKSRYFKSVAWLQRKGLLSPHADVRDPRVRARLRVAGFVPLYEGKSIWLFDAYYRGSKSKSSLKYFLADSDAKKLVDSGTLARPRLVFRAVARSTDQRTGIWTVMPPGPHGNNLPGINNYPVDRQPALCALLNSLVIDYLLRMKVSAQCNWFYVETLPVPVDFTSGDFGTVASEEVPRLIRLGNDFGVRPEPIVHGQARMATRLVLDALTANLFDVSYDDFVHITSRFPIYDKGAQDFAYPNLAAQVYSIYCEAGQEAASAKAKELTTARAAAGFDFGLDEVYVPDGGWELANAEARQILEAG